MDAPIEKKRCILCYKPAQRFKNNVNLCAGLQYKLCHPIYGVLFLAVKITARRERGVCPVRNGGGELADALAAAVSGGKNAPDGRLSGLRHGGVALRGERHERRKALQLRLLADGDEKTVHAKLGLFAGNGVPQPPRGAHRPP